jgi:hypothetical protein
MKDRNRAALEILIGKAGHIDASTIDDPAVRRAQQALARVTRWPESDGAEKRRAEQDVANAKHDWAKRQMQVRSVEAGPHGGYYYVTAQGTKVYVRQNPGAEVVGQVSKHPFVSGLPATAFLQEPKKR